MNKYQYIIDEVNKIIEAYDTTDPISIAEGLGIIVKYSPISAKGYYFANSKIKLITLQKNMISALTRSVLAHEIGHDRLHSEKGQEVTFIDDGINLNNCRTDLEANIFASVLLIRDDEIRDCIFIKRYDIYQIGAYFDVDPNLVALYLDKIADFKDQLREIEYNLDFLE